jgi:cholesterol transport system auxiliary component
MGCTTKVPAITQYVLQPNILMQPMQKPSTKYLLKVAKTFSNENLMGKKMWYIEDSLQSNIYHQSQWVSSPNTMLTQLLVEKIRQADIFSGVVSYRSHISPHYRLESNLEEFVQYFDNAKKQSYVVIKLSLELLTTQHLRPLAMKSFTVRVGVKSLNAKGGVEALNSALEKLLQEVISWLKGVSYDQ